MEGFGRIQHLEFAFSDTTKMRESPRAAPLIDALSVSALERLNHEG